MLTEPVYEDQLKEPDYPVSLTEPFETGEIPIVVLDDGQFSMGTIHNGPGLTLDTSMGVF